MSHHVRLERKHTAQTAHRAVEPASTEIRDLSWVIQCQAKDLQAFIEVQHGTVRHLSQLLDSIIEVASVKN